METAPYATELPHGRPLEANEKKKKIMACGKCVCRVLGTKDLKAWLPVIQFFYFMFLGPPKACIYHVCHLRCSKGGKRYPGPVRSKLPFLQMTSTRPCTCSCPRGVPTHHRLLISREKGTCIKADGCSYFISEMHRAEAPASSLEYFQANYMRELLRPAPCGISFVPSSEPYVT